MTLRLFFAVPLPGEISNGLGRFIQTLKKHSADIKWVRAESIHITLKFLGETDEGLVTKIFDAVKDIKLMNQNFIVKVEGIGFFPDVKRPRVIWVGLNEDMPFLSKLSSMVESAVEPLGFKIEKRGFSPHITIGRIRSLKGISSLLESAKTYESTAFGEFKAASFNLYSSTLKPAGAEYRVLYTFKL